MVDMVLCRCYFMLQDTSKLAEAQARLRRAREQLHRSYGPNLERMRVLHGNFTPELAMWAPCTHLDMWLAGCNLPICQATYKHAFGGRRGLEACQTWQMPYGKRHPCMHGRAKDVLKRSCWHPQLSHRISLWRPHSERCVRIRMPVSTPAEMVPGRKADNRGRACCQICEAGDAGGLCSLPQAGPAAGHSLAAGRARQVGAAAGRRPGSGPAGRHGPASQRGDCPAGCCCSSWCTTARHAVACAPFMAV